MDKFCLHSQELSSKKLIESSICVLSLSYALRLQGSCPDVSFFYLSAGPVHQNHQRTEGWKCNFALQWQQNYVFRIRIHVFRPEPESKSSLKRLQSRFKSGSGSVYHCCRIDTFKWSVSSVSCSYLDIDCQLSTEDLSVLCLSMQSILIKANVLHYT